MTQPEYGLEYSDLDLALLGDVDYFLEWVKVDGRAFSILNASKDPGTILRLISKMELYVKAGYLEHFGDRRGWYRPRTNQLEEIDFVNAVEDPLEIWLPFELSDLVEIHEGNVIIFSGIPNSGKTAMFLNIIRENRHRFNCHYFSSEMGGGELKKRLDKFPDMGIDDWNFKAYRRSEKFQDVIQPKAANLNIIDFLEVHDEFYMVGKRIKEIHDRLDGSVAIIGLQKNPGQDTGLGGYRMMEVTRLAVALDSGRVKITKAKNFRTEKNPNGLCRDFKLVDGCRLSCKHGWYREEEKVDV